MFRNSIRDADGDKIDKSDVNDKIDVNDKNDVHDTNDVNDENFTESSLPRRDSLTALNDAILIAASRDGRVRNSI